MRAIPIIPVSSLERGIEFYEGMRSRGVVFEDYDLPDLKTEGGIASIGNTRGAWFKDPDGNILAVESRVPARVG